MKYPDITLGRVEAVWNKLGGEEGVQRFLSDVSEVVLKKNIIDCDSDPYIPEGWELDEHLKGGFLQWEATKVRLYRTPDQERWERWTEGHKLRTLLSGKLVLNANVLDFLLDHPHLIPEEWKGKFVYFWGTIYRDWSGDNKLYVRYLYFDLGMWDWQEESLDHNWGDNKPAAVSA